MHFNVLVWNFYVIALSLPLASGDYSISIFLERFADDSSGSLYNGQHCDPFWFTGYDKCDIRLQICFEPVQYATSNVSSCGFSGGGFIDLQQVTRNANSINFSLATVYGGWYNPNTFTVPGSWQGFQLKVFAQDADYNAYQLIDRYAFQFTNGSNPPVRGTQSYSHIRPGLAGATFLQLAWSVSNSVVNPSTSSAAISTSSTPSSSAQPTYVSTSPIPSLATVTTPATCCHGSSILGGGCTCQTGWTGPYCCNVVCQNGGTAIGSSCTCPPSYTGPFCGQTVPAQSCANIYTNLNVRVSGYHNISTGAGLRLVLCDMTNAAYPTSNSTGGWTVIQNRVLNETGSFNRTWAEYKNGFTNSDGAYWLGNDIIHSLVSSTPQILRVDLWDCNNTMATVIYPAFSISNESSSYTLSIANASYTSTATDALASLNGKTFQTYDNHTNPGLANIWWSGWWFPSTAPECNLNGQELNVCHISTNGRFTNNIQWYTGFDPMTRLATRVQMKIRPISF